MIRHIEGRDISDEMLRALAELLRKAFGAWPPHGLAVAPEEYLDWMLRDFPGGARVIVAEEGSRVVGALTVLSRAWWLRGRRVRVRDGVNLAIDPDFRLQGLYRRLRAYSSAHLDGEFDLRFAFNTVPATRHVARTAGTYREPANRVRALLHPLDPDAVAIDWASAHPSRRALRLPLAFALRAARRLRRAPEEPRAQSAARCPVRTLERFDPRIDAVCEAAKAAFDFLQARDRSYLAWRYFDPRSGGVTTWIAEDGEQVLGYAVGCMRGNRGYLADLLALPGRIDVAALLVDAVLDHMRDSRANGVLGWLPERHPYARVLRRKGFLTLPTRIGAMYGPLRFGPQDLAPLGERDAALHVVLGDSDHV